MGKEAFETGSYGDYISLGLLADRDTEACRYAEEIRAKLNAGREVKNIEMGQLAAAVYAEALGVGEKRTAEEQEAPENDLGDSEVDGELSNLRFQPQKANEYPDREMTDAKNDSIVEISRYLMKKGVTNEQREQAARLLGIGPEIFEGVQESDRAGPAASTGRTGETGETGRSNLEERNAKREDRLTTAAIQPMQGTPEYTFLERAQQEYGIDTLTIPAEAWEEVFGQNTSKGASPAPMCAFGGRIYIAEGISFEDIAVGMPHEATHVMKQVGYRPYIELLEEAPSVDFSKSVNRAFVEYVLKHCGLTYAEIDVQESDTPEMHARKQHNLKRLYDEILSFVYGEAINGRTAGDTELGYLDFKELISNFDELFEQMKKMHEEFKVWNKNRRKHITVEAGITTKEETIYQRTIQEADARLAREKQTQYGIG